MARKGTILIGYKREMHENAAAIRDRVINCVVIRETPVLADPLNYRHYLLMSVGGSARLFAVYLHFHTTARVKREEESMCAFVYIYMYIYIFADRGLSRMTE